MRWDRKTIIVVCAAIIAALAASYGIGLIIVGLSGIGEYAGARPPPIMLGAEVEEVKPAATVTKTITTATATGEITYPSARMLIKTASMELESEDPEAAADKIVVIVESYGGYVAKLSSSGREKKSVSMIVKVPEATFYQVLEEIRRVGEVVNEEINVQDVTEQYVDLEARLRNLRAEEEWLLAAVDKAESVQDLLMIEKELWRVRGEIERIEAQLKNLERMVSYSTISIWIRAPKEPEPPPPPYPEIDFTPVIRAAITALIYVAYGLVFLIIVGAPISLIAYGAYMAYRRIARKKA